MSQLAFSHALLRPDSPVPPELRQPDGGVAEKRFDVYRNNVVSSLVDAVVAGFPALHRLLGDEYLRALAAAYVREHPPVSPILARYGESLPAFVQGFALLAGYPYLADVARLELALRASHNAADAPSRAAAQLDGLDAEQLMQLVPVAHPSLQLLASDWPVFDLWRAQIDPDFDQDPDLQAGGQRLLLLRPDMQVQQFLLEKADYAFAGAIDGHASLGEIAAVVLEQFPDCDFVSLMARAIQRGTIAHFSLPEEALP